MKIGILIASERRNGNCDLLGKYGERFIKGIGDESEVIYLKDYDIRQCQGCMSCVFKNTKCKIDDDLYKLADKIINIDGILLLAPTYVLTIPGKLKIFLDRFLCLYPLIRERYYRPAVSIGIASPIDWNQFQLPIMNMLLLAMGYWIVDSFFLYGAGQGEALLGDNIKRFEGSIKRLSGASWTPYSSIISKYCPIDFCTYFERINGNMYRCPVCLTPARLEADGFYFDAKDLNKHRWTKDKMREHFEEWILITKERFRKLLPEIYRKKKELGLF
jgi:multimeric flavodoxin WrbA|uniref:Flavodoxin family protein n=1 Tax=candidate division WOR-3 bacterium TaxID=2052148 RepID=A0A7V3RHQ4_UNCW3